MPHSLPLASGHDIVETNDRVLIKVDTLLVLAGLPFQWGCSQQATKEEVSKAINYKCVQELWRYR